MRFLWVYEIPTLITTMSLMMCLDIMKDANTSLLSRLSVSFIIIVFTLYIWILVVCEYPYV
jgi:hypothetical protein